MGLVIPVVDRLAEVDHPEEEEEHHRKDERELHERCAPLLSWPPAPRSDHVPSRHSPSHSPRALDLACDAVEDCGKTLAGRSQGEDADDGDQRNREGVVNEPLAVLVTQSRPNHFEHALALLPRGCTIKKTGDSPRFLIVPITPEAANPRKAWATHPFRRDAGYGVASAAAPRREESGHPHRGPRVSPSTTTPT